MSVGVIASYDWTPHDNEIGQLIPATSIDAWAATGPRARMTLFIVTFLAIRRARASL